MIQKPSSLLKTDVTFFDYDGDKLLSVKKHRTNMTVLGGRLDILEKPFGIPPDKTQRLFLNKNMIPLPKDVSDVTPQEYTSIEHDITIENLFDSSGSSYDQKLNRRIGWFCIGTGGENSTQSYVINEVNSWETRLYQMVPFRFVKLPNADLSSEEKAKYRLRKEVSLGENTYAAYFAKAFDVGTVHSVKNDVNYLPTIADSEPYEGEGDGHPMQGYSSLTYVEFVLEIDSIEFKEYYRATHNNTLTMARLSELGLITGLDAYTGTGVGEHAELAGAELFAKMTHDLVFMTSEGSRRRVQYKVYS